MPYKYSKDPKYVQSGLNGGSGSVVQRVIVPKGLINPDRTTVIEIPANLQHSPAVIAERKEDSYTNFQPVYSSTPRNVPPTIAPSPYSSVNTSASAKRPVRTRTVIETTRYTEDVSSDEESPSNALAAYSGVDEKTKSFPRTGYTRTPYTPVEDTTYGGMEYDYTSSSTPAVTSMSYGYPSTGYSYPDTAQSEPYFSQQPQSPQYSSFQPPACSTPTCVQLRNSYLKGTPSSGATVSGSEPAIANGGQSATNGAPERTYKVQEELQEALDNLDTDEFNRIQDDLKKFQSARRRLILDATALKPQYDIKSIEP